MRPDPIFLEFHIRATLVGNPLFVNGRAGRALHLTDGQRFEVANPLFVESSEFSLSFWIKLDRHPDTRRPMLDGGELALYLEQGFPKLRVRLRKGVRNRFFQFPPACLETVPDTFSCPSR